MNDLLINATGSGDTTLIAAPGPGRFIRVYHYHVTSDRPTTVQFKSASDIKDIIYSTMTSGGGISTPEYSGGVFDCGINEALTINLSVAAGVGGAMKYTVKGSPPSNTFA